MPVTWNLTFDTSWDIAANGGNFGGDTNAVQGTLTPTQQMAAARAVVDQVLAELRSFIDATSTMNIQVGWGTCINVPITGAGIIAHSAIPATSPPFTSYGEMRNRMLRIKPNAINKIAFQFLPNVNPYTSSSMSGFDGNVCTWDNSNMSGTAGAGFVASTGTWDYTLTQTVGSGLYHLLGVARHEISQALGRAAFNGPCPLGMFIYSSPGVIAPTSAWGTASGQYFSANGGVTNLGNEQTNSAFDTGDFDGSSSTYASLSAPGVIQSWGVQEWTQFALTYPITPLLQSMIGVPSIQHIGWKWR